MKLLKSVTPMIPEVEATRISPGPRVNSKGWGQLEYQVTRKLPDGTRKQQTNIGWVRRDPITGSLSIKDWGNCLEGFFTVDKHWVGEQEREAERDIRALALAQAEGTDGKTNFKKFEIIYQQLMSEQRTKRRHAERIDKQEVTQGLPRLEHYLKKAVETYGAHLNANITQHLAAGHTLPYQHIQIEYNIMKGFVPMEAIADTAPIEEIQKLKIIKDPTTGKDGVEAAYIRMDKILHLTPETLERKRKEVAEGIKQHYTLDLQAGQVRVIMYQAMVPLGDKNNFNSARYRLVEDFIFSLTSMGLEYQEIKNSEEAERRQQMQREDVQAKVKEVEEMFTISKGGNQNSDTDVEKAPLQVQKEEAPAEQAEG